MSSRFGWMGSLVLAIAALATGTACEGGQRSAHGATVARSSVSSEPIAIRAEPAPLPVSATRPAAEPSPSLVPSASTSAAREVRAPTEWLADLSWNGTQRVAHAKSNKGAVVQKLFDEAGVTMPPHELLFRIFKKEAEFEVWAGDKGKPLKLIATYGICAASGELGPKRREGDLQVPEGYYKVGYYHPMSSYYLSAQVNYPNASDKVRGGPSPGSDILIHGRCASIGCVSMTDERVEEIYLMGWAAFMNGRPTNIHLFPARDFGPLYADPKYAAHHDFWREIEPGKLAFERTKLIPEVTIQKDGHYVIGAAE